jgi:cellulose synthase/poly-beta-1,6-N-acetylglucosamine synthase-like glycosyltransferase
VFILNILSVLLLLCYSAIILFFLKGWLALKTGVQMQKNFKTTVTVLIPVRNEAKHIATLLKSLQAQHYPISLFKIILIDDHSTDQTVSIAASLELQNLQIINLALEKPINSYKKKAISTAIAYCDSELIITTDGDCTMGPDWISSIVSLYEQENCQLISAPVAYHQERNMAEKMQTVEFELLIAAGAACIQNKFPNTCNGANLAYSRSVFHEVGGFKGIDDVASGDDELLLHKIFRHYPNGLRFLKDERAIVYTEAKASLSGFFQQRKRWASKSVKYADKRMVVLVSTIYLFNLMLFVQLGLVCFSSTKPLVFLLMSGVKLVLDGSLIYQSLRFFNKRKLILLLPFVEFFYMIYILIIGIIANIGGAYKWKGRTVN